MTVVNYKLAHLPQGKLSDAAALTSLQNNSAFRIIILLSIIFKEFEVSKETV